MSEYKAQAQLVLILREDSRNTFEEKCKISDNSQKINK